MTSTHTRPAEPTRDSPVESLAPLPVPPSLTELREALSSPGVIPAEVDALIAAIAQRPPEGAAEALRERTDFLLSLMTLPGDASVLTGSAGTTVHTAAVEALLELGYPYALEVPPDALERARRERGLPSTTAFRSRLLSPIVATAVTLLCLVLQLTLMALPWIGELDDADTWLTPSLIPAVAPALLAILGTWTKARPLQCLGSLGLGIQGLVWFGGVFMLTQMAKNVPWLWVVAPWYLPLIACYLVWPRKQSGEPDATLPPPEAPEASS